MAVALAGLRSYQEAPRHRLLQRPAPMRSKGRVGRRDYGGDGPPVVFVPSLINPPDVLDLSEGNSLLRWLAGQGVHPYLVDWGHPTDDERDLSVAGHVEELLAPLLAGFGDDLRVVGYCLGGTMGMALAMLRPLAGLCLLAAPWIFSGFPDSARATMTGLWAQSKDIADRIGYLPMEVLQIGFWQLDPGRTVSKFERFATLEPGSIKADEFLAIEDWANGGAPLTYGAARELVEDMFAQDFTGHGRWRIADRIVDPAAIACPILNIVSQGDRIVPAESATAIGLRRDIALGHVGMLVSSRAREAVWAPLAAWLIEPLR
jgi:polyhydroxyalkanoate synthase